MNSAKKKPFESPEFESPEKEALNIARTSDQFQNRFGQLFRFFGLTGSQHNVLRILRDEERSDLHDARLKKRIGYAC